MLLRDVFESRRSVNFFDSTKALKDADLRGIIELAGYSPSAFNLQPWRVIAVKTKESKEKLFNVSNKQPKILDAPVTLILIGNREGYNRNNNVWEELIEMIGKDQAEGAINAAAVMYGGSEEKKIKFAESNVGLYAMSIMLAAKDLGIDSHPMSGIDFNGIKSQFNLKEEESPVMLISLGYFDESKQLYPRRKRRPLEEVLEFI